MNTIKPKTVDEYIALQSVEQQTMLQQIRKAIKAVAPKSEEVMSYGVPCYKQLGMLIAFGTHKKGCSLYAMRPAFIKEMQKKYKGLKAAGSTIHFETGTKLPVALVKEATKMRLNENLTKAKEKTEKLKAAKAAKAKKAVKKTSKRK